jgi:hypothetical protein
MRRREFIALLGGAAVIMPFSAGAEPVRAGETIAARLAGTWRFVSSINIRSDGSSFDRWGANPKGTFMFDGNGHFAQVIIGAESRFFGAKSYFAFGSYSVDEASKTIVTRIEGSSIGKLNGTTQRRIVTSLTEDELKYFNPATSSGTKVEAVWQRMKAPPAAHSAVR